MSIVIVGAGPNLGLAVARRFGREGCAVGLVSRTPASSRRSPASCATKGSRRTSPPPTSATARRSRARSRTLADRLGPVEVLEYSPLPAKEFMKPILETTVDDVRGPLEFSVLGAVAAVTAVIGPMLEAGRGSILFTTGGAAVKPYPLRAGVGISFAGEVAYARMLHDELADNGVHVAHTAIAGRIAAGRGPRARRRRRGPLAPPHRADQLPGPARHRLTSSSLRSSGTLDSGENRPRRSS